MIYNCPLDENPHIKCPLCLRYSFNIGNLKIGQWSLRCCESCGQQLHIVRSTRSSATAEPTGKKQTKITVTLVSDTVPPIEMKVNTWRPLHSDNRSPEEFFQNQKFYYEEYTCPTNWLYEVEQMSVGNDHDPHGLFRLVSIEEGHFKDPCLLGGEE